MAFAAGILPTRGRDKLDTFDYHDSPKLIIGATIGEKCILEVVFYTRQSAKGAIGYIINAMQDGAGIVAIEYAGNATVCARCGGKDLFTFGFRIYVENTDL
jgi:hypothetical protein